MLIGCRLPSGARPGMSASPPTEIAYTMITVMSGARRRRRIRNRMSLMELAPRAPRLPALAQRLADEEDHREHVGEQRATGQGYDDRGELAVHGLRHDVELP